MWDCWDQQLQRCSANHIYHSGDMAPVPSFPHLYMRKGKRKRNQLHKSQPRSERLEVKVTFFTS